MPGKDIPVESRIMTIADIFDALTASDRPVQEGGPDRSRAVDHRERGEGGEVRRRAVRRVRRAARSTSGSSDRGRDHARPRASAGNARCRGAPAPGGARPRGAAGAGARAVVDLSGADRRRRDPHAEPRLPAARSRDRRAQLSPAGTGGRGRIRPATASRWATSSSRVETARRRAPGKRLVTERSGSPSTASATCSATTTNGPPRRR